MRIRTLDGPPLPGEIAEQAARAIALRHGLGQQYATGVDSTRKTTVKPLLSPP
ncbi:MULTISPECIES: hypothetical protein [unclassified Rhodococcus (in: high G+C Gram-positive bacteria)]|uniref:hypothetical protein n=1 Tax=unclassified Rhodococcus (in: high G+C Gram-positive bacteria) TaxID=192944 RepID=UPI001595EE83|nr:MULTISPECIES: hypothetical protein [unclassified Rhodococcus (in: high G+C Gram-positive bacteria)]